MGKDNKIGRTHLYTHKIELKPDAKPMQFYPFRMAPHKAELMEEECRKLVEQDILEETNTGPWSSRSFLVEKKGGQGHRLVTDLRYVNSQVINQALTSPRADDSLEMIGEMRPAVFSKMDAQQGYFQIPIREEDRDKVAFLTRTKKYRYKSMPMGLSTSAQAFQAVVNLILQNLQYKCAIPYLDDILCLSPNVQQHFIDLRDIFNALRKGNLKLKKTKCEFFLQELDFLGMKVTTEGIKPSPDKIDKIKSFTRPKNVKDVRSFTGLAQFYRKFIKGFSETARPLFDLLRLNNTFSWTVECEQAFQSLKDSICEDVILLYPDYQKEFHLTTDASGTALGATLSQYTKDGDLRPVAFTGRSLHDHERNYGATQREMLGVVFAVEYFRHYLEGKHFMLYTDHQALINMLTTADNKNMWARWSLKIQQFSFTIMHVKGKLNVPADAMSRREYPLESEPMTEPPPKPKRMRVQSRVNFSEKIQIQNYNEIDTPDSLYKAIPKTILKMKSTHHFFCTCPHEQLEKTSLEIPSGTFSKLRQNHDIPTHTHKVNAIYTNTHCPMHPTPTGTPVQQPQLHVKSKVNTQTKGILDNHQVPGEVDARQPDAIKHPLQNNQYNQINYIEQKTHTTPPGLQAQETPTAQYNNPSASPQLKPQHLTPTTTTRRTVPGRSPTQRANQDIKGPLDAADRTFPGQSPPRLEIGLTHVNYTPRDMTPLAYHTNILIPFKTKDLVTPRHSPGQSPASQSVIHTQTQVVTPRHSPPASPGTQTTIPTQQQVVTPRLNPGRSPERHVTLNNMIQTKADRTVPGQSPPPPTLTQNIHQIQKKPTKDAELIAEHIRTQTKELMEMMEQLADPQISLLKLKREQKKSATIMPIIKYIEAGEIPATINKRDTENFLRGIQDYIILEGILVHMNATLWKKHKEFSFQPVIPEDLRLPILKLFHDIPMAGHAGAQRMLSTMLPKVFWKNMAADVQKFTASCHICLKSKKMNRNGKVPMTKHSQTSYPFQFIHIDAIGPLPTTPAGHKHIQVVVDRFSKFCIAYPTTALDAATTTAEFIEKVILTEGAPTNMQSDNGTSYKNATMKSMCSTFSIKHIFSSPYRPKSNGQAERYVKTISEGLRAFCMDHQDTWDILLPYLVFSMNNTESAATGFTPFFIMKGRNPNSVVENKLALNEEKSLNMHIIDKLKRIDYTYNEVIVKSEKVTEKMREQHDKNAKETQVKKESLVYVRIPRLLDREKCLKLQEVYAGPYIVCKFISKTSVILKSIITMKMAPKPVHVDRLKLVRHVRNNDFIHRLIDPNDDLINKLWRNDGKQLTPKPILLQTTNIYRPKPSHSKIRKRARVGLRP